MKLTALFVARRGRTFLQTLSQREGRNYQFDFLRPTHSLFSYFNRLVDQYSKVLHPPKKVLEQLKERAQEGAKWKDLELAKQRARWEQLKREKEKKREDDKEAERSACVVSTIRLVLLTFCQTQSHLPRLTGTTTLSSRRSNSRVRTLLPSYLPQ